MSHFPTARKIAGDEESYLQWATEIIAGEELPREALRPSRYPYFVAAILAVSSPLAVFLVQTALLVATAFLLADLTRRLSGSRLAGAVAGALVVAYPPLVAFAHYFWPEVPHLFCFIAALWILVAGDRKLPWYLAAGVLLGLAVLTKSILEPFIVVLLFPLVLQGTRRERILRPALVLAGLAVIAGPAFVVSWQRGQPLGSTPATFNIWVGLNDSSRRNFVDEIAYPESLRWEASAPTVAERDAILRQKIRDLVRERGFLRLLGRQLGRQYFRLFDKDSFLADMLPGGAMAATHRGYDRPSPAVVVLVNGVSYVLYGAVLVAAVCGIAVCPPRGRAWLWVILAFLAYNLALFLVLHVKTRYRVQFLPFLFLYAGCATAWATARLGLNPVEAEEIWQEKVDRGALAAAGLVALVLLFFAFGGPLID